MSGELVGVVAVILFLGTPLDALYTYYPVCKLRTGERLAALARGVAIGAEPEVNQASRSRCNGILLVAAATGDIAMFGVIAHVAEEPGTLAAAAVGLSAGHRHWAFHRFHAGPPRYPPPRTSSVFSGLGALGQELRPIDSVLAQSPFP